MPKEPFSTVFFYSCFEFCGEMPLDGNWLPAQFCCITKVGLLHFPLWKPLSVANLNKTEISGESGGNTWLYVLYEHQLKCSCGVVSPWPFLLLCAFYPQVSRCFQACQETLLHFWCCVLFHIIESKIKVDTFLKFYLYRYLLKMQLWFKWTSGTQRDKNLPSTSKDLVGLWSILRHCMWNHAEISLNKTELAY